MAARKTFAKFDFWNNPLVVSAFRLRFRRSGTIGFPMTYLLLLVTLGACLHYYRATLPIEWTTIYLVAILSIQGFVSAIAPLFAVSGSMQREMANRTWDFQRITALSPFQILIGKLLGEGSNGFLALIATVPFSVWCMSFGAASLPEIVLIYLNLVTTTIFFAAVGLLHPLDLGSKGADGGSQGKSGARPAIILLLIFLPQAFLNLGSIVGNPWLAPIIGLFTPAFSIYGIFRGNAAQFAWQVFGQELPYIAVTPLFQLAGTGLIFHIMRRRIVYLQSTTLNKPVAYALLALFDLILIGMQWNEITAGPSIRLAFCSFWTAHFVASLVAMFSVTPTRSTLLSWVWRYRGQKNWLWDLWMSERSQNSLAVVTFWLIGMVFSAGFFILLPYLNGQIDIGAIKSLELPLSLTAGLLLLCAGLLFQLLGLLVGRAGIWGFIAIAALLVLPPHLAGYYYADLAPELGQFLLSLAPSAHFYHWFNVAWGTVRDIPEPTLWVLWSVYGCGTLACWIALRRQIAYYSRDVNRKLAKMGVVTPDRSNSEGPDAVSSSPVSVAD